MTRVRRSWWLIPFLLVALAHAREGSPCKPVFIPGLRASIISPDLRHHWLYTGLGVALAFPMDQSLKSVANEIGLMPEPMARFGDYWGGGLGVITILPGLALAGRLHGIKGPEACQRISFAFSSLLSVSAVTYILKPSINRRRPNGRGNLSFPSGHTSFTFGIAEVVRTLYGNRAGTLFYLMALNTGISRIHDNKHYLSDVIAGAGLGIGVVRGFRLAENNARGSSAIRLLPAPGGASLILSF